MARSRKFRDVDEWYREMSLICEIEIEEGNRIKILDNRHIDSDTERTFWHGITIQRFIKSRKGRWVYRGKLNIPYSGFSDFCMLVTKANDIKARFKKRKYKKKRMFKFIE
jgi:hypothetical protein